MVDAVAEAEGISISNVSFKALIGKGMMYANNIWLGLRSTSTSKSVR